LKRKIGFLGRQLLAYGTALSIFLLALVGVVYGYVEKACRENAIVHQEQLTAVTTEQVNSYFNHLMLLANLAPVRPGVTLGILVGFFAVMNVLLFRDSIFGKRRKKNK